jgi:DNA-binding beta-propeller fold protein YncE
MASLIASGALAGAIGGAAAPSGPQGAAAPAYRVVHGWPVLPEGRMLGGVAGVGVDSRGNVFVFHRGSRTWSADALATTPIAEPTVAVFDGKSGVLLQEWGAGLFAMPHGLTVDAEDNVWLTDVALQQVFKFSHDGRPLLTLGERGVAGKDHSHFDLPTGVAVTRGGTFYVSDGYKNTRVVKFARDGTFLSEWGTPGSGPGQFDLPHAIALDASGRLYVADRSNARVEIFDAAGKYIGEWKGQALGRPYGIAIAGDGTAFVADGGDQPESPPDRSAVAVVRPDGSVVERFGRFGNYDGQFAIAHDIAVARDGSVYVGDVLGQRVQKFVRGGG